MTESPGSREVKQTENPNGTLPILVENGSIGGGAELWKQAPLMDNVPSNHPQNLFDSFGRNL